MVMATTICMVSTVQLLELPTTTVGFLPSAMSMEVIGFSVQVLLQIIDQMVRAEAPQAARQL